MSGVTVLNTYVKTGYEIIDVLFFVGLAIALADFGLTTACAKSVGHLIVGLFVGLVGLLLAVFSITFGGITETTRYEVTVSESVNFVEFTNRYKVIEQRGEIYVVELREEATPTSKEDIAE